MNSMTEKRFYAITPPDEGDKRADMDRLLSAVEADVGKADLPYRVLQRDYAVLRASDYRVTVTLLHEGDRTTLLRIQGGDTTAHHYGFACDLGSTTIAVQLVDLNSGTVLATKTAVNRQVSLGTDILTRIFYTQGEDAAAHRKEMQALAVTSIDALIAAHLEEAHIAMEDCPLLVLAGNTTMTHFLLGIDAFSVFMAPFAPMFFRAPAVQTAELGFAYDGTLWCFPSAANYLGGDIVSGLLATNLPDADELSLFIDIGTNGEMAIGCKDYLIAGAGAAGPALEGGISKSGMRAAPGAVDSVRIQNGALTVTTIGGEPPCGICGSGIVDLLAQLLLAGWMTPRGTLVPEKSARIISVEGENGESIPAVVYAVSAAGEELIFTQADIEQFTHTKAAAHTMVACLLEAAGVPVDEVKHIYLAGAFGEHIALESAITIGLYPDIPRGRFVAAGNTSLRGAYTLLCNREGMAVVEKIMETVYYLEFAMQPNFTSLMSAAMFYPHTDLEKYPSVKLP